MSTFLCHPVAGFHKDIKTDVKYKLRLAFLNKDGYYFHRCVSFCSQGEHFPGCTPLDATPRQKTDGQQVVSTHPTECILVVSTPYYIFLSVWMPLFE